jgi:hypothetical protein
VLTQVSKDGLSWTTLYTHVDDGSLNEPGSTSSWPLEPPTEEVQGWRHVRLQQTGKNASGQTHYLSLSGFEIYGTVTGVCEDLGKAYSTLSSGQTLPQPVCEDLGKAYSTLSSGQTHYLSLSVKI